MSHVRKHTPLLFLITLILGAFALMQPRVSETAEPVGVVYAALQGRPRGQVLNGGTDPNDQLVLNSTANTAKGAVILGNDGSLVMLPALPLTMMPISAASRLLGRGSLAGAGAMQELTLGDGLILNGTELSAPGARNSALVNYTYSATLTEAPGAGQVRMNAAYPYTAVTKIWMRTVSSDGQDVYWGVMIISPGSSILVQDKNDHTLYARFTTTALPIDKTTYVEVPVVWQANGAALGGGQEVLMQSRAITTQLHHTTHEPGGSDPLLLSAASRLWGRGNSGAGAMQEILLGSGLAMTGTTLSATGGGGGASCESDPNCAYLPGRAGGQDFFGGTGTDDFLGLMGTNNANHNASQVYIQTLGGFTDIGATGGLLSIYGNTNWNNLNADNVTFRFNGNTLSDLLCVNCGLGGDKIGINSTNPAYALDLRGSPASQASMFHFSQLGDFGGYLTSTDAWEAILSAGAARDADGTWKARTTTAAMLELDSGNTVFYGNTGTTGGGAFTPTERVRITSAGNVGIGNAAPQSALEVSAASDPALRISEGSSTTNYLSLADTSTGGANVSKRANTGSAFIDFDPLPIDGTSTAQVRFFRNTNTSGTSSFAVLKGNNSATINSLLAGNADSYLAADNGKVGIGTALPEVPLHVKGAPVTVGSLKSVVAVESTEAFSVPPVAGMLFMGKYNAAGTDATSFGGITAGKENATDGDYAGYLALHTRVNGGSPTERMRISSTGNTSFYGQLLDQTFSYNGGVLSSVVNANAGVNTYSAFSVQNSASMNDSVRLITLGSGYTSVVPFFQDGATLQSGVGLSGGLTLVASAGDMRFFTTGSPERMRIASTGAVSIYNALDVALSQNNDLSAFVTNVNAGALTFAATGARNGTGAEDSIRVLAMGTAYTGNGGFFADGGVLSSDANLSGGLSIMARAAAGDMRFYTGGHAAANLRMTVDSAGPVSIYNNTDVTLSTNTPLQMNVVNTNAGAAAYAQVGAYNGATVNDNMRILAMGTAWTTAGPFLTDSGVLVSGGGLSNGMSIATAIGDIRFYTNGFAAANERMQIDAAGNVGIGTTAPDTKLDVAGTISYTLSATQAITAASNAILCNAGIVVLDPSANLTLTSVPTIANGAVGQICMVILYGLDVNTVTVQDNETLAGSNLQLSATTRVLNARSVLTLMFNGTDWLETSYALN